MTKVKEQLLSLNKTSKKSVALYHKCALASGISDSALGILYALLDASEPCSQYDLVSEWSIPKQTINTTVNALLKKGLVTLTPAPGAKNKKNIALTDSGRDFAAHTVGALLEAERAALESLAPEERDIYIALNKKYNEALSAQLSRTLSDTDSE